MVFHWYWYLVPGTRYHRDSIRIPNLGEEKRSIIAFRSILYSFITDFGIVKCMLDGFSQLTHKTQHVPRLSL